MSEHHQNDHHQHVHGAFVEQLREQVQHLQQALREADAITTSFLGNSPIYPSECQTALIQMDAVQATIRACLAWTKDNTVTPSRLIGTVQVTWVTHLQDIDRLAEKVLLYLDVYTPVSLSTQLHHLGMRGHVRGRLAALVRQGDRLLTLLIRTLETERRTLSIPPPSPLRRPPIFVIETITRIDGDPSCDPSEKGDPK